MVENSLRALLLSALSLVPVSIFGQDQNDALRAGNQVQVQSAVLKESRTLIIAKPASYGEGAERYPVLYLLDGRDSFQYTTAITAFLADNDRIPEMIVVAIDSGDFAHRTHDLTPLSQAEIDNRFSPRNGGAEAFLAFISDELIPYIEKNYRTRPYRILVGHSFGGLFAIHSLITKPQLFDAYIAIDPTLSWNNEAEVTLAETFFANTKHLQRDLFVTGSNNFGSPFPGIRRLAAILDEKTPQGFRFHFEWMKNENHTSIPLISIYSGLDTTFEDWHLIDPVELYDKGGLEAIQKHFRDGGLRYGYDRTASPFTISLLVAGLLKANRLQDASAVLLNDPKNYPPPWNQLDALARAYADRGDRERAIQYYKLSLKQNPQNEWARKKLVELGATVGPVEPNQPK